MKTYMYAIRPKWCEKIFNGGKTIEVRKKAPKPPFKVVVYETKKVDDFIRRCKEITEKLYESCYLSPISDRVYSGRGKVIGEFICNEVVKYSDSDLSYFEVEREIYKTGRYAIEMESCLTIKQMREYSYEGIVAIEITAPVRYDKPRELGEFYKPCDKKYASYCKSYAKDECISDCKKCGTKVTHAPQSYMEIQDPEESI